MPLNMLQYLTLTLNLQKLAETRSMIQPLTHNLLPADARINHYTAATQRIIFYWSPLPIFKQVHHYVFSDSLWILDTHSYRWWPSQHKARTLLHAPPHLSWWATAVQVHTVLDHQHYCCHPWSGTLLCHSHWKRFTRFRIKICFLHPCFAPHY